MIMTVAELKEYITTKESDAMLEAKLQALEESIRNYTNNRFHAKPKVAVDAFVRAGVFLSDALIPFAVGDTIQVTHGDNAEDYRLYTVKEITDDTTFTVNEDIADIDDIQAIKVVYPMNIKMGVVNLMKWELENRDKVGIQSETISRHSITYTDANGDNYVMGYPKALMGFLNQYRKARF